MGDDSDGEEDEEAYTGFYEVGYSHLAEWFRTNSMEWGLKGRKQDGNQRDAMGGDFVGVMGGDLLRSESILYRVYDRGRGSK